MSIAICLIPAVFLVLAGYLIKYKKAYWLISGYNTMSADRKKNVNIEGLAEFIANICFVIAAIVFVASIFMILEKTALSGIVFALMLPVVIYTLIHAQRYDGNNFISEKKAGMETGTEIKTETGTRTGTKVLNSSIIAIVVLVTIGVGILLYSSSKPAEYTLKDGILDISGIYGQEVVIDKINSLEIKDTIPEVLMRTNGSAMGSKLKGYFKLEDIGRAKLFIDKSKPPFIYVNTNEITIILNCDKSEETKALYEKLKTELQASNGGN